MNNHDPAKPDTSAPRANLLRGDPLPNPWLNVPNREEMEKMTNKKLAPHELPPVSARTVLSWLSESDRVHVWCSLGWTSAERRSVRSNLEQLCDDKLAVHAGFDGDTLWIG